MALRLDSENIQAGMQMAQGGNPTVEAIRGVVQRYKDVQAQRQQQAGELDLFKRKSEAEFDVFKKQEEFKTSQKATETEAMRGFEIKKMEKEQGFKREMESAKRMGGLREIKYKNKLAGASEEDLKLWKQAEDEVVTRLGGSAMMGIRSKGDQYYNLIEERYNELKERFGGGISAPVAKPPDEENLATVNW